MLPTKQLDTQPTTTHDGYQILNISNMNAKNEIVLNDEQLLALIQSYPFLYNPHVRPHNDPDYEAWAWEQITKAFNRNYEQLDRNVWYTTIELEERWKVLQPIVRSLSKINNIDSLPDTLRQIIIKMSVPMDEKPNESLKKPLSIAQKTLLSYEPFVKSLSLADRRRLEAEMMELILNSELDSKATVKVGLAELQTIEKEYNDFLKVIGLDEMYMIEQINNESVASHNTPTTKNEKNPNVIITNGVTVLPSDNMLNSNLIAPNYVTISDESVTSESTAKTEEIENNLLEPILNKRWVPLDRWQNYVRKCRVRIKRVVVEDDLPLAVIKREKIEKNGFLSH